MMILQASCDDDNEWLQRSAAAGGDERLAAIVVAPPDCWLRAFRAVTAGHFPVPHGCFHSPQPSTSSYTSYFFIIVWLLALEATWNQELSPYQPVALTCLESNSQIKATAHTHTVDDIFWITKSQLAVKYFQRQ
jgi:hypothetical protein